MQSDSFFLLPDFPVCQVCQSFPESLLTTRRTMPDSTLVAYGRARLFPERVTLPNFLLRDVQKIREGSITKVEEFLTLFGHEFHTGGTVEFHGSQIYHPGAIFYPCDRSLGSRFRKAGNKIKSLIAVHPELLTPLERTIVITNPSSWCWKSPWIIYQSRVLDSIGHTKNIP